MKRREVVRDEVRGFAEEIKNIVSNNIGDRSTWHRVDFTEINNIEEVGVTFDEIEIVVGSHYIDYRDDASKVREEIFSHCDLFRDYIELVMAEYFNETCGGDWEVPFDYFIEFHCSGMFSVTFRNY